MLRLRSTLSGKPSAKGRGEPQRVQHPSRLTEKATYSAEHHVFPVACKINSQLMNHLAIGRRDCIIACYQTGISSYYLLNLYKLWQGCPEYMLSEFWITTVHAYLKQQWAFNKRKLLQNFLSEAYSFSRKHCFFYPPVSLECCTTHFFTLIFFLPTY